jgi:hypothetical protein
VKKAAKENLMLRLITGDYANSSNIVARCNWPRHPGFLSKGIVKIHGCVTKNCSAFEKLRPEYWQAAEKAEQDRKNNRLKRKQAIKNNCSRDALIRETLEKSGHIHVTSIREESRDFLIVSYIYDRRIDLTQEIRFLREKLGKAVRLMPRIAAAGAVDRLIRKPRRETREVTDVRNAPKVGSAAKKRLEALGVYCLEDLFGRSGDALYKRDCEISGKKIDRRYLTAYRSAVEFAKSLD